MMSKEHHILSLLKRFVQRTPSRIAERQPGSMPKDTRTIKHSFISTIIFRSSSAVVFLNPPLKLQICFTISILICMTGPRVCYCCYEAISIVDFIIFFC